MQYLRSPAASEKIDLTGLSIVEAFALRDHIEQQGYFVEADAEGMRPFLFVYEMCIIKDPNSR